LYSVGAIKILNNLGGVSVKSFRCLVSKLILGTLIALVVGATPLANAGAQADAEAMNMQPFDYGFPIVDEED